MCKTPYSNFMIDLRAEPMVVSVPEITSEYYVLQFPDFYTHIFAFIDYFNFLIPFLEPVHADDQEAMARFAKIGIAPGAANKYTLHFKKNEIPPAKYFWSVTMYDKRADGTAGYMVDNPIDRYLVNSTTAGLVYGEDGSLTIYIQDEQPEGEKAANWLPAPAAPFYMAMRIYGPKERVMKDEWAPPAVKRVD